MTKIGILEDRRSFADDLKMIINIELPKATVKTFHDVDSAIEALKVDTEWDIWIIDLMMPSGDHFSAKQTNNGLATGTRFIEWIDSNSIKISKKIIVYTSRNTDDDNFKSRSVRVVEMFKAESTQVDVAKFVKRCVTP